MHFQWQVRDCGADERESRGAGRLGMGPPPVHQRAALVGVGPHGGLEWHLDRWAAGDGQVACYSWVCPCKRHLQAREKCREWDTCKCGGCVAGIIVPHVQRQSPPTLPITAALAIYYSVNDQPNTTDQEQLTAPPPGPVAHCDSLVSYATWQQASYLAGNASIACVPTAPDRHHGFVLLWFAVAWLLTTLSFQLACPIHYTPLGEGSADVCVCAGQGRGGETRQQQQSCAGPLELAGVHAPDAHCLHCLLSPTSTAPAAALASAGWHLPAWLMPWLPSAGAVLVLFK